MGIEVRPPAEWPQTVRSSFEEMIRQGGEVTTTGLSSRIAQAKALACHFTDNQLTAIAALKNPRDSYVKKVGDLSGFDLDVERYPYEVGWIFVDLRHRGKGLSLPLVVACLAIADSAGVFATTRQDNTRMQRTLRRCGFVQVGIPYLSDRGCSLLLFVRKVEDNSTGNE